MEAQKAYSLVNRYTIVSDNLSHAIRNSLTLTRSDIRKVEDEFDKVHAELISALIGEGN